MAWSLGLRDLAGQNMAAKLGIKTKTTDQLAHTGITGAESNVNFYQALLRIKDEKRSLSNDITL